MCICLFVCLFCISWFRRVVTFLLVVFLGWYFFLRARPQHGKVPGTLPISHVLPWDSHRLCNLSGTGIRSASLSLCLLPLPPPLFRRPPETEPGTSTAGERWPPGPPRAQEAPREGREGHRPHSEGPHTAQRGKLWGQWLDPQTRMKFRPS